MRSVYGPYKVRIWIGRSTCVLEGEEVHLAVTDRGMVGQIRIRIIRDRIYRSVCVPDGGMVGHDWAGFDGLQCQPRVRVRALGLGVRVRG